MRVCVVSGGVLCNPVLPNHPFLLYIPFVSEIGGKRQSQGLLLIRIFPAGNDFLIT